MKDSAPLDLYALLSCSHSGNFSLECDAVKSGGFLESRRKRAYDDLESEKSGFGSFVWDAHETQLCRETDGCGPWSEQPQYEFLPHQTQRRRLRKRFQKCFYALKSMPEQPQDELFYENPCRAIREIVRKQAQLPRKTQRSSQTARCDLSKGWVRLYDAVNYKPKHDERPHETQRARRLLWGVDEINWPRRVVKPKLEQDEGSREPWIQQIRFVIVELDSINYNDKTTTKYVLPNGHAHGWEYVSAYDTIATGGTQPKTAIGSYLCSPVNQRSKCNNNYSQSQPISGNHKDEDPWKGNKEEDNDPNGGTTVITIRDEDRKSAYSYKSSFACAQFSTLAISSFLLCLMVLFPNFAEQNQAITGAALMGATLGSLVSLETILKCPSMARTCGYFAIISLLVAIGSILSTSVSSVTT